MSSEIPIINFSAWTSSSTPAERQNIAKELVEACHRNGFVYLSNHGVPLDLVEESFVWSKQFFDLPTETKMEVKHPEGSLSFRGYDWPGLQKGSRLEEHTDATNTEKLREIVDHNVRNKPSRFKRIQN